jgi:hypothetical protein
VRVRPSRARVAGDRRTAGVAATRAQGPVSVQPTAGRSLAFTACAQRGDAGRRPRGQRPVDYSGEGQPDPGDTTALVVSAKGPHVKTPRACLGDRLQQEMTDRLRFAFKLAARRQGVWVLPKIRLGKDYLATCVGPCRWGSPHAKAQRAGWLRARRSRYLGMRLRGVA